MHGISFWHACANQDLDPIECLVQAHVAGQMDRQWADARASGGDHYKAIGYPSQDGNPILEHGNAMCGPHSSIMQHVTAQTIKCSQS
eukprot:611736-Karenia_brevis.AAC.1